MSRIIRNILVALLLFCLTATLAGCGSSGGSSRKICPSCGKSVTSLITKKDVFGDTHTWCSGCWSDYHAIMGY